MEKQHGENTIFVKTIESDEVLGYDLRIVQSSAKWINRVNRYNVHGWHCVKSFRIRSYSVRMRENADQNNYEYGHFSRSVSQEMPS